MWKTPEFWVLVAFAVFILALGKTIWRQIGDALDKRSAEIKKQIEDAQKLRVDAQSALAAYQLKQRDALKEAEQIVAHAKAEAERVRAEAAKATEAAMARREAQALDKIAQAEAQALNEVRGLAVDIAIASTRKILSDHMDERRSSALVEQAIAELPQKLH
ncbi:MAG: F0F1 ATP synthase subunit B [Alphaproteobacteria bacterium]|nr:F0F1 ATP synthase subunit B [Alphaproteobacteria bacterium]